MGGDASGLGLSKSLLQFRLIGLRRDDGSIVFSACRALRFCSSALESEFDACLEGVTRALEATSEDMIIETDCIDTTGKRLIAAMSLVMKKER
jgi:hypothetical protein